MQDNKNMKVKVIECLLRNLETEIQLNMNKGYVLHSNPVIIHNGDVAVQLMVKEKTLMELMND